MSSSETHFGDKLSLINTHTLQTGQPITFPLQVRPARNFPIDLYLLMDLSFSMSDDLDNLKRLGSDLGMWYGYQLYETALFFRSAAFARVY